MIMRKNEYILTNKNIKVDTAFNHINIDQFNLYHSKDIDTYISKGNNNTNILLGYAIHIYESHSEQELIDSLRNMTDEDILNEVDLWCGHFMLIVKNKGLKLYTDACSSFKVFYGKSDNDNIIGSDPSIIRKFSKFNIDNNKEKYIFYNSEYFKKNPTKIGHDTRFNGLYQLVSNHFLDVEKNQSERIFPREKRKELTQKEAIEILSKIFKHIIKILNERYIIYTSLTAGYDSRLLMSATKEISQNITYYTFQRINSKKNLTDYKIPQSITKDLSLKYSFIKPNNITRIEKEGIKKAYDLPKMNPFIQYKNIFPKDKKKMNILLVGFFSEVAKNYLERVMVRNGKDVVRAIHFPDNKYLERYYQEWLDKNQSLIKSYNYKILDFIHWEQDITNFAGQNTHYSRHHVKLFSVFNSREILKIMLSVDPKYRDAKDPVFFRELIKKMWPNLLKYPFNPTIKENLILLMKKIRIYNSYKYLQMRYYKYGKI